MTARRAQLSEGFEVEWCSRLPKDPVTGDADMDGATIECADFATVEAARAKARAVLPLDAFRRVSIQQFTLDADGYKQYFGDPEVIDDQHNRPDWRRSP